MAYQHPSSIRLVLEDHPELQGPPPVEERAEFREVRSGLAALSTATLSREEIVSQGAAAVGSMKSAYEKAGMIVMCTMRQMTDALAIDDGTTFEVAQEKIMRNAARGFTAEKTGIIYMRNVKEKAHDIVHELVHATSAPGGTTKVKTEFGDPLNEGLTEYHTIDICAQMKVPLAKAYEQEVAFVTRLEGVVGPAMLFDAYMKNAGMAAILAALADRWAQRAEALAGDESTRDFVPPAEASERTALLGERLKGGAFLETWKPFWAALLA